MRLFIQNDEGQLVGTFIDGDLRVNSFFYKEELAFALFNLLVKMMNIGGGASYGSSLAAPTVTVEVDGDSDFGTAGEPV